MSPIFRACGADDAAGGSPCHVAAFYEEVRVRFYLKHIGVDTVFDRPAGGSVVAEVSIRYLRETLYGEPVMGCAGIAHLGDSSYTLAQALFQGDHCVSEASCLIAQRANGFADPLSAALRERLASLIVA